ncbi:MAG TPA: tyrosine-type recombinase/integrase [Terriglobia bacterium]|nr:tyrosine-type recombinase/integrase [Terriglobia bacterium]
MKESTGTSDRQQADAFLRERLDARDDGTLSMMLSTKNLTFAEWADWFLERRSKPPFREEKTHLQNQNAVKLLKLTFANTLLSDITPEAIEDHLWRRLNSDRRVRTKLGIRILGKLKPSTVHQELRVLTRMLNVAVQLKRLSHNPCNGVEFPVSVSKSIRKPHYMTAAEQAQIEFWAPPYLKNTIVILTETGLRPFRELMPMKKEQVDLENCLVHIPDSKTPTGIGDMPMTQLARDAFKAQVELASESEYLFPSPSPRAKKPYVTSLRKIWEKTLRRAGIAYFPLYHLRHTFATRLSAGGVADHFVTQMLRQGDASVFKRYSQAKLAMMREALAKLDRHANEHEGIFGTARPN